MFSPASVLVEKAQEFAEQHEINLAALKVPPLAVSGLRWALCQACMQPRILLLRLTPPELISIQAS
jgi:hypothetical protein